MPYETGEYFTGALIVITRSECVGVRHVRGAPIDSDGVDIGLLAEVAHVACV